MGCALGLEEGGLEESSSPPVPVNKVELERYVGEWFSVARIPNRFESDCLQSRAEYSALSDGTLRVVNSCPTKDGKQEEVEGKAWILDPSNAKLEVGFFHIFSWYPQFARGNYWVLGLGPINSEGLYSYAVVGEPSRKYGWILARTRSLPEEELQEAFEILKGQGYSAKDFELLS
jgi:apolipoprotein D and lipocalin family protein